MELRKIILPLRQWWWLLIATTIIAAASSYITLSRQPPIYESRTTLMVGRAIEDPNPTGTEFSLTYALAQVYADMAERDPIRVSTMEVLGLNSLPEYQVRANPGAQLIDITVVDTNPARAQAVASELANQLVLRSPTNDQQGEQSRQEFINTQLNVLEEQIKETQENIASLQDELGRIVSAQKIAETQNQILALQTKVNALNETYASLLANTQQGAINTLQVIEPAELPKIPMSTNKQLIVIAAAAIGFILAAGLIYLIDYLDDTVKTSEDVERLVKAPIIGYISELDMKGVGKLLVADNPRHPSIEEYRTLRTNLKYSDVEQELKTILVSGAVEEDGKTSVAANLAVVIAQSKKKVILIDADLRRPNVHNFFGFNNNYGLTDLFLGNIDIIKAMKEWDGGMLSIITAGNPPPNPTEILDSSKMDQILDSLKELADLVIVDGPPFLVADAAVLAAKTDGVLLVIRAEHTPESAVKAMMDQINYANAKVVGVALNRIPNKGSNYYNRYRYYASYYDDEQETFQGLDGRKGLRGKLSSLFWRINPNNKSRSGSRRVFNEIDMIEGETDSYRWDE